MQHAVGVIRKNAMLLSLGLYPWSFLVSTIHIWHFYEENAELC